MTSDETQFGASTSDVAPPPAPPSSRKNKLRRPKRGQRPEDSDGNGHTVARAPQRKPTMRHVALLIESSGSYGRGLLRGIAKYNREHGRWSTYFRPHG
ncbi:MAG TPA: hypothetical protein VLI90_09240, partial [Tepidisphaeraceae bacterium]|nr:hypothetical protein [Tepidisphaeraceae bacterium]